MYANYAHMYYMHVVTLQCKLHTQVHSKCKAFTEGHHIILEGI